jgi:ABC-type antimicrobial peptide transport system permease subunit
VAVVGAAIGLLATLAGGRLVAALLYGVSPTNAATLAGAVAALLAVCATAVLLPALRAARADPARELRAE